MRNACQFEQRGVAHIVSGRSSLRRMSCGLPAGNTVAPMTTALPNACVGLCISSIVPTETTYVTGAASNMVIIMMLSAR